MKKTQWLDAFQNIRKQMASFLSVIAIAMLAVLLYLGISYSAAAMERNISSYYEDRNMQDAQVASPLLLTEEDLQAICALEGVQDAEGGDQTNAWLRTEALNYELSVLSLPKRIAVPEILEGRAPETAQECMLEKKLAEKVGLQMGDHIRLTGTAPDSAPALMAETEFTVTGFFSHPDHITENVRYDHYVIVTEEAFDQNTLEGNWMRARVALSNLPDNRFSKDYTETVHVVEEKLRALSAERSSLRFEEVRETYEKRISDGEAELKDAKARLEDADRQLMDAEAELANVEAQLADGEQQLQDGEQKLRDSEQKLRDGEEEIADGEQQLKEGEQKLRDGEQEIADGEQQLREGEEKLLDSEQQIADGEQQIRDGEQKLQENEEKLRDAEQRLADGEQEIADGEQQLKEGEQKLRDVEAQLRDAEAQIADGERQLQEAEAAAGDSLAQLEDGKAKLAEAERMLSLAPGELAAGEAKLRQGEEQLSAGKEKLDNALEKLETALGYIDASYAWMKENNYLPTPEDIALGKEIAEEFDVDIPAVPDAFPEDFLDWPEDKATQWLKDNFGYSSQERRYLNERKRYLDGLQEYEQGVLDYYYSGEQYLDGLTAYENGKKAIEAAEAQLQELNDAKDLLEEKKQELEAGKKDFEAGREELEAKREELENGRKELEAGREEYEDGKKELEAGREELEAKREELENGKKELEAGREELEAKREELENGKKELEAGREELEAKREELENGKRELADGRKEYEDGKAELEAKREELLEAKKRIEESRAELREKKQEYEKGLQDYEDYRARLDSARDELSRLKENAWIVMNNQANVGYVFSRDNSGNLMSLSGTFALLFVIIAALVIYASVGRMVDEQSVLVGTTKALGFYNREVLFKYMVFGVLGTMLGVLLGIVLAWGVLQPLILHMYASYYNVPEASKCFLPVPSIVVALGGLALSVLAVWIASKRLQKQTAKQLMSGETPVAKRKNRGDKNPTGSLYTQLIILNMTSDLKRVIVTVISIAGCCMLLLIGYMLKNGQDGIADRQFGEIQTFEAELRFDPTAENAEERFSQILDEFGADYIPIYRGDHLFAYGENMSASRLVVAEPDSLPGFYNLYDADYDAALPLPEQGILVPKRLHEDYNILPETTLILYDGSMQQHESKVAGIFNAYCERIFFLSQNAWRGIFGERAVPNSFFVKLNGREISELTEAVSDAEGFLTVTDATLKRTQLKETAAALNVLIIVMIVIAGFMAFFILVNLSGSYMIHKKKELTIMRINGFSVKECTRYAATELIVTTVLGILLGLLVGSPLGYWIQKTMETADIQEVRGVDPWSIFWSILITAGFSLIINGLALRKVKTLKLSDI